MMKHIGQIRIKTLVKFLNLCILTTGEVRLPTLQEIMERNNCCKANAYNYLRALKYLYPEEVLERIRQRRQVEFVQQTLE